MQEFFYKTVKYCFIGLICLVGLAVVFVLFSDTDKPQVKRSVGQPKKADVEVQVQSLSDLRKQQDALIAKRQKIWDQQEALVVNDKLTDEKKYNALAEVETQLSKTIVGLSKKIVKAKNQQRVNAQAQVKKRESSDQTMAIFAYRVSQDVVKERLSTPSTAKFPSYVWDRESITVTHLGNQRYSIRAHVDAQNMFGAMVRQPYEITLQLFDGGRRYKVERLNMP